MLITGGSFTCYFMTIYFSSFCFSSDYFVSSLGLNWKFYLDFCNTTGSPMSGDKVF